jgi:YfiH family protein
MTADCLPVLLCDVQATVVGAAHAGWKGLASGVLEATIADMQVNGSDLMAWLGPAIGQDNFEVGDDVRDAFLDVQAKADIAFKPGRPGKWYADIYALARQRLEALGVSNIYGGGFCTYRDTDRFYSFRRDGKTGRMGTFIWLE